MLTGLCVENADAKNRYLVSRSMSRRTKSSAIGTNRPANYRDRRPLIGMKQTRRGRRSWSFHNLAPLSGSAGYMFAQGWKGDVRAHDRLND